MSVIDTIERIQNKPEATRRRIMYVTLAICMTLVFLVWAVKFTSTLRSTHVASVAEAGSTSPIDYIKGIWEEIKGNKINQ